jgi:hypothetical protein
MLQNIESIKSFLKKRECCPKDEQCMPQMLTNTLITYYANTGIIGIV